MKEEKMSDTAALAVPRSWSGAASARRMVALLCTAQLALFCAGPSPTAASEAADSGLMRLHLLWTNDLHGHIAPEPARFMNPAFPPPLGGAASAARYIKQVRAQADRDGEYTLLVDVGDMFQGTPIGNASEGTAVIDYFNAVGYQLAVPGNHDFDLGRENAERLAQMSEFPWVCANLVESATGEVVDWCTPTLMLTYDTVRIGVIGIITPSTGVMSFPEHIRGLEFLPMAETVARYRDELRGQGADLIFLAIHEGLPYDPQKGWAELVGATESETSEDEPGGYGANYSYGGMNLMQLANTVPGLDFAVGGHTHRGYPEPWIDPANHTMCFETYGNGSSLGHVTLLIDRATKTLVGYEVPQDRGTIVTLFEDEIWPDPEITELIRPWREQTEAELDRVVGYAATDLVRGDAGSNLVGNLVTDAMREYFDADFSFQNLGGLRANVVAGPITGRDVFAVLPFGNELLVVKMPGTMIRRIIERKLEGLSNGIVVSGAAVTYDRSRPDGDRIVALTIGGQPWAPERIYSAVCTNFLMEGNSGLDFLTAIPAADITPTQITTAEALTRYLELHSPVSPRIDDRWVEQEGRPQAEYLKVPYLP